MNMGDPVVSAIIPVYNQERYLALAIDSILAQTFRDFEVIVVDDGSTDSTPEILASYGARIRTFRKANGGVSSALNLAIREARGKWIGWLSSDDLWEPTKLACQLDAIREHPSAVLCYTDVLIIDPLGNILERQHLSPPSKKRELLLRMINGCFINGCSTLVRRDVFEDVGLFDEQDRFAADYDMWLRIAQRYDLRHVPEPLVRYRVHPGQGSRNLWALERAGRRVASRALRRMGPALGTFGAMSRLTNELALVPWQVRHGGGSSTLSKCIEGFFDSVKTLVDPEAQ